VSRHIAKMQVDTWKLALNNVNNQSIYTKKHKERKVGRTQSMVVQKCKSKHSKLVGHSEDLEKIDISAQTNR
jgi:hypothetical protein